MIDRLVKERNHSFALIIQSFSYRERERESSEMNQPNGDIDVCWFSILFLTSLSRTNPSSTQIAFCKNALNRFYLVPHPLGIDQFPTFHPISE